MRRPPHVSPAQRPPHMDGSGYISPCSIYSIEADLMAEKDELFDEEDKHELARRLEQEVAGSILALWRERLVQPMMGPQEIKIGYDSDDDAEEEDEDMDETNSTSNHTATSTSPRSSPYSIIPPPAQFADGSAQRGGAYPNSKGKERTGFLQSEDSTSSLEAARMKLRKTRFDYSKDTLHRVVDITPQQLDFRHVLRKGDKPADN